MRKLTLTAVRALPKKRALWDSGTGSVRGFGVRCQELHKTFILKYRLHGRQHIYTIGRLGDFTRWLKLPCTVENARKEAEWARAEIVAGRNPLDAVQRGSVEGTVETVVAEFVKRHAKARGLRTANEIEATLNNYAVAAWRGRPLKSITRADVVRLLDVIADAGKPGAALKVRTHLSSLFRWAIGRGEGGVEVSPVFAVPMPHQTARRDRVLTTAEVAIVWSALEAMGYPFGQFIQLAILLGQRRSEVAEMRWQDIDDDTALWTIPAEANKAGRVHVVPLPPLALEILRTCPKISPPAERAGAEAQAPHYVFTTSGKSPISGFSKATLRLRAEIEKQLAAMGQEGRDTSRLFVDPWTIHDLRRTAATGMAQVGVPRFVIGRVLNHADASVTGVYDRWQYLEEKRAALNAWGDKVRTIINTPLRTAA